MKETIANSAIFTIMMVFIVVIMLLVVSSLNYSKAFKAKNRIVDLIEKYDTGYEKHKQEIDNEIGVILQRLGYHINTSRDVCPTYQNGQNNMNNLSNSNNYLHCIYKIENARGTVYHVVAYMYWELPFIGNVLKLKVEGDTIPFYETIDNYRP